MDLNKILTNLFGTAVHEIDDGGSRQYSVPGKYPQRIMDFLSRIRGGSRGSSSEYDSTPSVNPYITPNQPSAPTPKPTTTPTPVPQPSQIPSPQPTSRQIDPNDPYGHFGIESGATPSAQIAPIIERSAAESQLLAAILAAMLYQESTFRPDVIAGPVGNRDVGIAQINERAYPNVSREQAFNPEFAIPFMANKLRSDLDYFGGDYNRAIAAYNVGRGGASVKGNTPSGLGERGQFYLDNVIRNLSEELRQELGLIGMNL